MHVRRAALERAHEHLIDHANDRHLGSHVAQMGHILVVIDAVDLLRRRLATVGGEAAAVERLDARRYFLFPRQNRLDAHANGKLQRMQPRKVQGIGGRNQELPPIHFHRNHPRQLEKIADSGR